MKKTLTERIAEFVLQYSISGRAEGIKFFVDCFGCMIAGCTEKNVALLAEYAKSIRSTGVCTLFRRQGAMKAASVDAARANAAAAHVHDYDDVSLLVCGHPSVATLPAALAIGEQLHRGGEDVLTAYMAGVDVMEILAFGLNPTAYERGWHTTTQFGTFGAAAAVGRLIGLDQEQMTMALGIAASLACGIRGNNGSMSKALQPGQANANGIMAAMLAKEGFRSNPDVMEGNDNYIQATVGQANFEKMFDFMDRKLSAFTIPDMGLKLYPSCKCTNIGIDLARKLQKEHNIAWQNIDSVVVGAQPFTCATLRYPKPETTLQGKFSMPFTVAQALVHGNVTMRDFEKKEIDDPDVIEMMQKVTMIHDPSIAGGKYTNDTYETNIRIKMKDGSEYFEQCQQAYGDPLNPCSMEDVHEKFLITAGYFLSKENAEKLYDTLLNPEKITDIASVMEFVQNNWIAK